MKETGSKKMNEIKGKDGVLVLILGSSLSNASRINVFFRFHICWSVTAVKKKEYFNID